MHNTATHRWIARRRRWPALALRRWAASGRATRAASPTPTAAEKIRDALGGRRRRRGGAAAAPPAPAGRRSRARSPSTATRRRCRRTPSNKDQATCAPAARRRCRSTWWSTAPQGHRQHRDLRPQRVARPRDRPSPSDGAVVFDQKDCVFLTHVAGRDRRSAGDDQEQRPRGPQHEHRRPEQLQPNDSRRAARCPGRRSAKKRCPSGVHCSIHPWMIAYMLPRKNRYFAVTAPDGTFEIPNLPAGEKWRSRCGTKAARAARRAGRRDRRREGTEVVEEGPLQDQARRKRSPRNQDRRPGLGVPGEVKLRSFHEACSTTRFHRRRI